MMRASTSLKIPCHENSGIRKSIARAAELAEPACKAGMLMKL
jgi:hypothetical protein